ncbi:MAG TPA: hypothetical protein VGQ36_16200 [Thermoanaerobaculia bacterium]|jgi:hypothetical protein|nr:hypothetical protein [Thermoanaerobaculia bacterium]
MLHIAPHEHPGIAVFIALYVEHCVRAYEIDSVMLRKTVPRNSSA